MITLTPEIIEKFNKNPNSLMKLPDTDDVLIAQVISSSPAAKGACPIGKFHVQQRFNFFKYPLINTDLVSHLF